MADRSAATITPFRTGGHEEAVAGILHEYGFDTDEACALPTSEPMPFLDGVEFMTEEVYLGVLDDVGPRLEILGVAYVGCQSARYEYPAVVRMFHPELGVFQSDADDVGNIFVRAAAIDPPYRAAATGPAASSNTSGRTPANGGPTGSRCCAVAPPPTAPTVPAGLPLGRPV